MAGCCNCCQALKPRYKRLVDSIFPDDPQEGLNKSNMDKLTYFVMKSPEKLDRIGEYLAQRLSRDIYRQRTGYVIIAMEALDTILLTCHSQSINVFVESFLKMVQKLLECNEPQLQVLATSSFEKFANIEEDTPSYHRRYDFFVSKFSSMAHSNFENIETRDQIRTAGLRGLHGVVRKTVSDDLQTNIWESTHMDKIVPSLLYNMQNSVELDADSPRDDDHPPVVAKTVFRDLVCRASFGNISAIINPVLKHLDFHKLWVPNHFAVKSFKIVMYSVQAQYGYIVVEKLMDHLDENINNEPQIKSSITHVLSQIVLIAAGGSIGPFVLRVFNTLLKHLRDSVEKEKKYNNEERHEDAITSEKEFQDVIIDTIGEFAKNLPDYQKIEILMFVMSKVTMTLDGSNVHIQIQLMKTMLKVATKYRTVLMVNAFPQSLLDPLIRLSLSSDATIRRIVQEILHTLLDRHDNLPKLKSIRSTANRRHLSVGSKQQSITAMAATSAGFGPHISIEIMNDISCLTVEKAPRQDIVFMKKNGALLYHHIYESMGIINNRVENFEALYCTLALLALEMGSDDILVELFRLVLGIQQLALSKSATELPITHKCAIHALVATYMNLACQLTAVPALCEHVWQVIKARQAEAEYYLPEKAFNRSNTASSYPSTDNMAAEWLFDVNVLVETLTAVNQDCTQLQIPYSPKPAGRPTHKKATFSIRSVDTVDFSLSRGSSQQSLSIDSTMSTPVLARRSGDDEIVTVESLKKMLVDPHHKEEAEMKRLRVLDSFRHGPFEDIMAKNQDKADDLQEKLTEIFESISRPQESPGGTPRKAICDEETTPIYDMKFPELFVY